MSIFARGAHSTIGVRATGSGEGGGKTSIGCENSAGSMGGAADSITAVAEGTARPGGDHSTSGPSAEGMHSDGALLERSAHSTLRASGDGRGGIDSITVGAIGGADATTCPGGAHSTSGAKADGIHAAVGGSRKDSRSMNGAVAKSGVSTGGDRGCSALYCTPDNGGDGSCREATSMNGAVA